MALYLNGNKIIGSDGTCSADKVSLDDTNLSYEADDVQEAFEKITKRLTYVEYEALTDAEKNNGTIYLITDVNGDGQSFQPIIYSTEEREIGVWIDGKPLYEKTYEVASAISIGTSWSNTGFELPTNTERIIEGFIYRKAQMGALMYCAFSIGSGNHLNAMLSVADNLDVGSSITIKYTKTSDTAGSGKWTPQGTPAVHYSGSEQVIGTWIDGSTLYQKTIEFACSSTNTTTTYTMDAGVNIKGYDTRGSWAVRSNHNILSFNCIISGSAGYSACLSFGTDNGDNNTVVVRHQQKDITNAVVTVIYTKNS